MWFCPLTDIKEKTEPWERGIETGERGENHGQSHKEYKTGRIGGWRGPQFPWMRGKEVRMGVEEGLFGGGGDWEKLCLRALHFPQELEEKSPTKVGG